MTIPQDKYEELEGMVKGIYEALQGKYGETGMVADMKELRLEQHRQGIKLDDHLDAHKEADKKRDSRLWDFAKLIAAPLIAMLLGAALVKWGIK